MELDKAIETLKDYYEVAQAINAKHPGTVRNPVAWALYKTWREFHEWL